MALRADWRQAAPERLLRIEPESIMKTGPLFRREAGGRGTSSSMRSPFVSSSEIETLPVGAVTELVEGDVYHWGSLMAGALFGSLLVAFIYSFFVHVSAGSRLLTY